MGTGEARGEARGLCVAGDCEVGRERGDSFPDGSIGAGERGDRGGDGAPASNRLWTSSLGTLTLRFCFGVGLCGEPYCKPWLVKRGSSSDECKQRTYKAVLVNQFLVHRRIEARLARHQG